MAYGSNLRLGVDFGLTNTDVALVAEGALQGAWTLPFAGPATPASLERALGVAGVTPEALELIATTGGRHRDLPEQLRGTPVRKVGEAQAIGRGGLALAGLEEALIVSAGSGTAMIAARGGSFAHFTGTAVGGGTLLGLAQLLVGTSDPLELARLATIGDASGVDTTLAEAIGGGIGQLPPSATAVNFGRVPQLERPPRREDLAAALAALVAQVVGVIALNAARAAALDEVVLVGHLLELGPVRSVLEQVWAFYRAEASPHIPAQAGAATALGAALAADWG